MPDELVTKAREIGLDAVCVTEHATSRGAQVNYEYAKEHGFLVFKGLEVYTELGDMLVFGWEANIPYYLYPFADLRKEVEERDGIIIPAHPCRGVVDPRHTSKTEITSELLEAICAIETRNGAMPKKSNDQAEGLKMKHKLFGTGGSDSHHVSHLGRCLTVFEEEPGDEVELIEALRRGKYRACYYDDI